jgi:hypothetical protein
MSPTRPNAASTESAPANDSRGPSSPTPDSQSIPNYHRTNEKLSSAPEVDRDVEEEALARALPAWGQEDAKLPTGQDGVPAAAWRIGGAVIGAVA